MKTFRAFVAEQVARGESLPPSMGYKYSDAAQIEICDFFESRAGERYDAERQSTLRWLEDSTAARKVKAVMDEIMQGDQSPTIASVRAVWDRMYGTVKPVNYDCPDCGGSGFAIVRAQDGTEGSRRCPRGCVPPPPGAQPTGQQANGTAISKWAKETAEEMEARFAKAKKPAPIPPPLVNPLSEQDIEHAERFKT